MRQALRDGDPNCWDASGARPLHDVCRGGQGVLALQVAAELLLAKADCRALDREGLSALALCQAKRQARRAFSP